MSTGKNEFLTSRFERTSYAIYFLGQNIFYGIVLNFLITYFADIGIPVAVIALITLVVRVWDAINDVLFGGIVDKAKFKKGGKFLPWVKVSLVFIPLATIFLYAIPSALPTATKIAWCIIGYLIWDTAYTVCDVPVFGLVTTMTNNQQERTSMMSFGRVFSSVGGLTVLIIAPILRQSLGGWLPLVVTFAVFGFITMVPLCFSANERMIAPPPETPLKIRDMLRGVLGNKYMLIFYIGWGIIQISAITTSLNMIMARHLLGGEQWMSLLSLLILGPSLIIGMILPSIVKKIDKFKLYWWATAINIMLSVVIFFVGYQNMTIFLALVALKGIPLGFTMIMMFMFTPDCIEYGTYKTGVDTSGMGFAFQSFCAKFATAVSTSLAAAFLAIIGFVESEGAIQAPGFNSKLWMIYCLVPIAGNIIGLVILRNYKLRDKDVQIMAKANRNEIPREEAAKILEGRY